MAHYNYQESMLPSAGGNIMAMRGGGVPMGYDPSASVLPATSNSIPIVDMKGGDETLPMAAAATVVSAPVITVPVTEETVTEEATAKKSNAPITANSDTSSPKTTPNTPPKLEAKPPGKPIRFILFGEEFNAFSPDAANSPILALLGNLNDTDKPAALQQIYDGIVNLRTSDLTTYPQFKRLLTNMGLTYAKQKNELKEEIVRPEMTEIKLVFPNNKEVIVTLTIKCDQMPSCSKNNLALAAAATVMLQKGGEDTARTIRLFGKDYFFPTRPKDINGHLDLLKELEVEDKDATFKLTLLEEIYDGCYTDGSIISKIKCSTFGTLLEELGQKYAKNMQKLLESGALPSRSNQKEESTSRKELPNGDIELTFTFSNFGKQLDAEIQEKISKAVQKSTNAQSFGSKLKHMVSTVSSDQVSIHGMDNQKNACFCISALQFLFSIPQIRTAIKKHGCKSELLAQILTQIHDPHYEMTEVNQDGIMCALFNLFEELGEDMALFSKLNGDFKAGTAVPYELLGYIMKNFFISINALDDFGQQQDASAFLLFLFDVIGKKIPIKNLFEFTIDTTRKGSSTNVNNKKDEMLWLLPLEKDSSGNDITSSTALPKQKFDTTLSSNVVYQGESQIKTDTIILKQNPYLLIQTSINAFGTGKVKTDSSGNPLLNSSGQTKHEMGDRYYNIDLTAIPPVFTIGDKTFKKFGSIQYRGTGGGGHYVYTRYDLSSKKGIVYNDNAPKFYSDISTVENPLPDYVLIYAEMGQEQKEAHFEEEAQKMEDLIRDKAHTSIEMMTKDINKSDGVDNNLNMHMIDFIQEGYMIGLDKTGQSGGGDKEELWKSRPPVGDLLFFKGDTPATDVKTKKNLSVADLCLMLKEYAQKTRARESTKSTSMDILSSEMDKAKDVYLESTDDAIKKNALVAYAIFDILKELMEGIEPISKKDLEAKSEKAAATQKNIAEKREAKEKEAKAEAFKKKHRLLMDAPAENTAVPTAVAAAAAAMSNESDATSEEVLSAKSETSEEDRQRQMAANEKRQQENMKGRNGRNIKLSSLPNSPLSSNSKLAAKKEQAASLLASMRTLSDEIKELKQDPAQNSNKIRDKIYELTAMRSNVNEIQGINKSNSTNAANILKEAMNPTQPVDSASSNAANAKRKKNMESVLAELKARQASADSSSSKLNITPTKKADSILALMHITLDGIKQLKEEPTSNSNKIQEEIRKLTEMKSNVNKIEGINVSKSGKAAEILTEAINTKQATRGFLNDLVASSPARSPALSNHKISEANTTRLEKINRAISQLNKPQAVLPSAQSSVQSSNLASFVSKSRKANNNSRKNAAAKQAEMEKQKRINQEVSKQMQQDQSDEKEPSTISDRITDSLRIAQILKDKPINDPAVNTIKTDFGIDASEMDKRKIMDKLLDVVGRWMKAIDGKTNDKSDPAYISTYVDYIALLVTKSMIDAQMGDTPIPNETAKSIAKRLIDNYSKMKNPKSLSIEQMAEHMIERQYYSQLEATSNQSQATSPRLQILNDAEQIAIENKAMIQIDKKNIELHELNKKLIEIKYKQSYTTFKSDKIAFNPVIHKTEIDIAKNYVDQIKILKDAIKKIGANTAISDKLLKILEEKLLNIHTITVNNEWGTKKKSYKDIAKTELELYKQGEVLRDKAQYHMGLKIEKPKGKSEVEAKIRAKAMSPMLYEGGRRTLRAAKKKRTLRAANKKRTLRASKKLRRSVNSK